MHVSLHQCNGRGEGWKQIFYSPKRSICFMQAHRDVCGRAVATVTVVVSPRMMGRPTKKNKEDATGGRRPPEATFRAAGYRNERRHKLHLPHLSRTAPPRVAGSAAATAMATTDAAASETPPAAAAAAAAISLSQVGERAGGCNNACHKRLRLRRCRRSSVMGLAPFRPSRGDHWPPASPPNGRGLPPLCQHQCDARMVVAATAVVMPSSCLSLWTQLQWSRRAACHP